METVVAIVNQGADPNVTDNQTFNALHLAAQFGFPYLCAYLVAKGVNVDSGDHEGPCRFPPVFVLLLPSLPPRTTTCMLVDVGSSVRIVVYADARGVSTLPNLQPSHLF
jgi:hypothetical protein